MGALLRIRSVETRKVRAARGENCKLRPHVIAVSDKEEEAKQGDAATLQLHTAVDEANVAVLQGDRSKPATTAKKRSERKKTK